MAVMAGVESAVQIHIDRGDDLNARDSNGMTPLMLSAARNKPAICKLLLDAGADDGLLDPSGRTAHAIAIAAGAHGAAAVLGAVQASSLLNPGSAFAVLAPEPANLPATHTPLVGTNPAHQALGPLLSTDALLDPPPSPEAASAASDLDEASEFDLSGWEAEEDTAPPEADLSVLRTASAIQAAISAHEPIDSSAEWDDIDAHLPEQASPLARADDTEVRARLRLLLLRAIREGSVPSLDVQELSNNEDRSANAEAEALLGMVINDLGAEVDERFEYASATESFEVFVTPDETPDEEEALDEALAAIDSAASPRHEPLRMYQREFQRLGLISAQEEVALGQAMERALEAALDALAAWPHGVARTLAAGAEVKVGLRPLAWMSLVAADADIEPALAEGGEAEALTVEEEVDAPEGDDESPADTPPQFGDAGLAETLGQLGALPVGSEPHGPAWSAVRNALVALRLNRRFLLELGDIEDAKVSAAGARYAQAMAAYREARDSMVAANLKLVFYLAKKYLYSGELLDDLAQEGNIGLLKAVERFDWRRGFKFSTYATWWIRQQVGRHVADKRRTIRIPVHVYEKSRRLQRETQAFESAFGRPPELEEIAVRMEMPAFRVAALQRLAPEPLPLHELPIDELIAIEAREGLESPDPAEIVYATELGGAIDRLLATLTRKEAQILRLRFGLGVHDSLTLDEIGQRYALTRERIRQIEVKALKKLKQPDRMDAFARAALGIQVAVEKQEGRAVTNENEDSVYMEVSEQVEAPKPRRSPMTSTPALTTQSFTASAQPSDLDQLLTQAVELGVTVEDGRASPSGQVWVNLGVTPDLRHCRLASKLLEHGFKFLPGKGYWR